MNIGFGENKTPTYVIKESAFGGANFRDTFSDVNGKWHRKTWKEFGELKNIDQINYCWNYYDFSVTKYGVKWGTSLRFWENNDWIN